MRLLDIKDVRDLRELFEEGRVQARKAIGAPEPRTVGTVFLAGVALGAAIGALVAILMTPLPGREARHRLAQRADQMREHMPELRVGHNGRQGYPAPPESRPLMPATARPLA